MPWAWFLVRDLSVVMEVVAVLLPVLVTAGTTVLIGVWIGTRSAHWLVAAGSWLAFGVTAIVLPWLPIDTGVPVDGSPVIAVGNVSADNPRPADAARDLLRTDADILVVPEDTVPVDVVLSAAYPYVQRFLPGGTSWIGVYSRIPMKALPYVPNLYDPHRYARLRIEAPTPFVLWALHLPRPWFSPAGSFQMRPGGHARVLSAVIEAMRKDAAASPVVAAGDLNLTDRGRGYRKITGLLDDAMRSIRGGRTEIKPSYRMLLLRIDHILEPPGWCADRAARFPIAGSDHRGVVARVGPCVNR